MAVRITEVPYPFWAWRFIGGRWCVVTFGRLPEREPPLPMTQPTRLVPLA